jgi:hypothetical protein
MNKIETTTWLIGAVAVLVLLWATGLLELSVYEQVFEGPALNWDPITD